MPTFDLIDNDFTKISCEFCNENFKLKQILTITNCNHIFHNDCIQQQLLVHESYFCVCCDAELMPNIPKK